MKLKNTPLAALTCASFLGCSALSQGAVLWADDFNSYGNGGFAHQGLGTGFGGNWFQIGGGGTISIASGVVTGNGDIRRDLGTTFSGTVGSTGTIWLSFDWGHNSSHTGTYGGLTFFDGDNSTERVLIGNTFDPANWNMNGAPADTGVSSIGMKTGVARITLNIGAANDVIDLWVGATGSPVDVSGAPMATTSDRNLEAVRVIRIMGGNDQTFDNLIIGTTMSDVDAVPEPSAALLGGLGLLALLRRRRA
jgi:MYXO-CTERM domain-containing protein